MNIIENDVWGRARYTMLVLSMYFPEGVSDIIYNYMKELEYEESRKQHMMDCVYFRVKSKLGDMIDDCHPRNDKRIHPNRWLNITGWNNAYPLWPIIGDYNKEASCIQYRNETMKHVDMGFNFKAMIDQFKRAIPSLTIMNRYEGRYDDINKVNEHNVELKDSWLRGCISFHILDDIKIENRIINRENRENNTRHMDLISLYLGINNQIEYEKDIYINRDKFIKKLMKKKPDTYLRFKSVHHKQMKEKHDDQKREYKSKRSHFKKNQKYIFQKRRYH